ncbi:hypothetical protein HD553DRAFT_303230 [Filobasidium floriforme]|uniref:uncharacterized protein n=1 Tax=Filobasidium floriforme TaxID=5210 RepID=UPI001E8EA620|nr:uncharacterized protein HD553DRAFT_303230 [Filobasidium floriforme]KAH8090736.1 hypothetical protein HD553DRAFT_303230 [Filobasidium floriforme]
MAKATKEVDIERLIAQEASDFIKELEVERVLKSFKLNPYDILDLGINATENEIKKQYRKKSLLIHPDKFKHPRGIEAFDQLKKAEAMLGDKDKRDEVDAVMRHARVQVLKPLFPPGTNTSEVPDDDPRLTALDPPLDMQVKKKAREVFVEEELLKRRAQKIAYANEGAEAAKKEAEINQRKRKQEDEATWESRRDERVSTWREFAGTSSSSPAAPKKTKKKKLNVLG